MDTVQQFDGGSKSGGAVPEKEARKDKFMRKIMEGDEVTKSTSFHKRLPTLKKKAFQLQTLCDVSVCVVSSGADGKVTSLWPEDPTQAQEAIEAYRSVEEKQRHKMTVLGYLEKKKKGLQKKRRRAKRVALARRLSNWIDGLPSKGDDALEKAVGLLESKIAELEEKMREGKGKESLESGTESSDGDDETNEEEIGGQSSMEKGCEVVSQSTSPLVDYGHEIGTHQPVPLAWNNGDLFDLVQSCTQLPRGDVGEPSVPMWDSGRRDVFGYPVSQNSMMSNETLPLVTSNQGSTLFQNHRGDDHVFGSYPNVSSLHEALPLGVWAPQYHPQFGSTPSQFGAFNYW